MAFNRSLRTAFVVESIAPADVSTEQLLPYQLGIFDINTWKSVTTPTFASNREVVFAVGSPNTGQKATPKGLRPKNFANIGNVNVSFKSLPIFGHNIDKAYVSRPVREAKQFIAYLGYNGVEPCKNIALECGKVYGLDIQVVGGPIRSVFGQDVRELIEVATPCCDSCATCTDTAIPTSEWIDSVMAKIEESYIVKRFIKAEKVESCCPAVAPFPTIDYTKYCLTLCDEGDQRALARVAVKYPGVSISRVARTSTHSTYEICQPTADAAPADLETSDLTVADCATCPAGFTLVEAGDVYRITIDNNGSGADPAAWLAEVQAAFPAAVSAIRTAFEFGTSTYVVTFPTGTVVAATDESTVSPIIKSTEARCVQDTPTVTSWTACGTAYKITRTVCMTKGNSDCNAVVPDLDDIQDMYEGMPGIVAGSVVARTAGTCISVYEMQQVNNECLEDGCDTLAVAKFDPIPAYNGHAWDTCKCEGWTVDGNGCPVAPTAVDNDCEYGIKFTGAFVDSRTGGCSFDVKDARFYDPIEIYVSLVDTDFPELCTQSQADYTITQYPSFEQLSGQEVIREVIKSRFYNQEKYLSPSMANGHKFIKAEGLEYGVDVDKHYYALHLFHNRNMTKNFTSSDFKDREEIVIYVPEDRLDVLDSVVNLVNSYTSSVGIMLPPAVV